MSIDPKEFRQTMGFFATGVTVIAAQVDEKFHAMTANAVTSLSLNPMLLLICIGKQARMAGFLKDATGFSVNILRDNQKALSTFFAGGWKEDTEPPFRFVPWVNAPRLEGCLAALACEMHEWLEGGDHYIVIGRVTTLHQGIEPRKPLLFYNGKYGQLGRRDQTPAPDLDSMEDIPLHVYYDPWHFGDRGSGRRD
jgi:flavin reductase (DIM6/NTAB) family NADH-FMN oxidoreductase RutF